MSPRLVLTLVLAPFLALLPAAALPQEGAAGAARPAGAAPQAAPTPVGGELLLREKTVYVPYRELEAIFEKEGRGVFLPYEEFLKLWRDSQGRPTPPPPDLPPAAAVIRGGTLKGSVSGSVARFVLEYEMESLKEGWSEIALPFKGIAIEKVTLSDPQAVFAARGAGGPDGAAGAYAVYLPKPTRLQATLELSTRVTEEPARKLISFGLPPTAVSRLELDIPEKDVRVEVAPAIAVSRTTFGEGTTKVLAFLGSAPEVTITWMPPTGTGGAVGAVILAEQAAHIHLGERILKLSTEVRYQALRGETDTLRVRAPADMRLISVKGESIREWSEEAGVVAVKLHEALKDSMRAEGSSRSAYTLALSFERVLEDTPPTLSIPTARVEDVLRESGWLVLSHEAGLNVRVTSSQGLSQLDREEVPEPLRSPDRTGFRYLAHPLELTLAIDRITPELRSSAVSVVTLAKEEDSWVGWVDYDIRKAGVFRLELRVPTRWSVGTMGTPDVVDDVQTVDADGLRTFTVSLRTKALGAFRLPFRLVAPGSAASGEATLVPPVVVGTLEDRGLFGVSAPRAFDVATLAQQGVTSADVDELFRAGVLAQTAADSGIPLTYGYRSTPASVQIRLDAKQTQVDLLAQHLLEISDGGIKVTHLLDFEILYAPVDRLSFTAPSGLDSLLKVEAKEKKEVKKTTAGQGLTRWEVELQSPTLGVVSLTLTHEVDLKALESGRPFTYPVPLLRGADVRVVKGFLALRKEGTLEISAQAGGMEAIHTSDLPDKLRRGQTYEAYRYFTADPSVVLNLTRYEYQPLATTIVTLLRAKIVVSEDGHAKTRVVFLVQNSDRQFLELELKPESILSLLVAGKQQEPRKRKDGQGTLIQIPPSSGPDGAFPVVLVYEEAIRTEAMQLGGSLAVSTPRLVADVPVGKVEVDLFLPPEFVYLGWEGTLKDRADAGGGLWQHFKTAVNQLLGADAARQLDGTLPRALATSGPEGGEVDLETRGLVLYPLETLSRVGDVSVRFVHRRVFSAIDFGVFLLAALLATLVLRKTRLRAWGVLLFVVFIPLAVAGFLAGPLVEVATSACAAGCLVLAVGAVLWLGRAVRELGARRVRLAPDPFLEQAESAPPSQPRTERLPDVLPPEDEGEEHGGPSHA